MKKLAYIIYLIFVCILVFYCADFITYKVVGNKFYKTFQNLETKITSYFQYYDNYWFVHCINSYEDYYQKMILDFRKDVLSDKNTNRPIILFGCSFAYGSLLEEKQTFAYKIAEATKRNVYNRSLGACGIQHMYYMLKHPEFYDILPKNPEYVVYIYIPTQQMRLNNYIYPSEMISNGPYLHYDLKGDELVLRKELVFPYKSFLYKRLLAEIDEVNHVTKPQITPKVSKLAVRLFVESKNLLKEKYPDINFIILRYNSEFDGEEGFEDQSMWKKLEEEGFIIINSKDLIGRKYTVKDTVIDKIHPSEQAWDLLVPKLIEKLGI